MEENILQPIEYTQEKVLCELQEPWEEIDPLAMQNQIDINMRIALAEWMAEVCAELDTEPEVFCLAITCLDRFLSRVGLNRQQLQLLGVSCLLIAWKVRGTSDVSVDALVRFTADTILRQEILEYEVLVLTKLNWNLPSAVAVDFVQHILQKLKLKLPESVVKERAKSLIQTCYVHPQLAVKSPQMLAAAAVISIVRPMMTMPPTFLEVSNVLDTPPSSFTSSSCNLSSTSSSPPPSTPSSSHTPTTSYGSPGTSSPSTRTRRSTHISSLPSAGTSGQDIPNKSTNSRRKSSSKLDRIIRSVQRVTLTDKSKLQELLEDIQNLIQQPDDTDSRNILNLTPSPESKSFKTPKKTEGTGEDYKSSQTAARLLFPDFETPTKVLDASEFSRI